MTNQASRVISLRDQIHIYEGLASALERWPEVSVAAFQGDSADAIVRDLIQLLDVDELQARAISDMQVRRLARAERERINNRLAEAREELAAIEPG